MLSRLLPRAAKLSLAVVVALTFAVIPVTATATDAGAPAVAEFAPDRVLVGFKPGTKGAAVAAAHAATGAQLEGRIAQIGVEIMRVPKGRTVAGLIKMYEKNPNVSFAEPDYAVEAQYTPNDPYFESQWGLGAVDAPLAWEAATGDNSITVAILDTGIDTSHPDLAGRVIQGHDFVNGDANAEDDNGHGTLVAGIVGANGDNAIGVAGIDWGVRLMPVKVLNSDGSGFWSQIAEGIVYAADQGAHVITMSLGGDSGSIAGANAVEYAHQKGTVLVAAAGNNERASISYPAAYQEVIAVGALANETEIASYSNYGEGLSLVAPGSSIYSTRMGGSYVKASGTSMAAPFVAGLVSILLSVDPSLTPAQIEATMQKTAVDLGSPGYDIHYGYGLIDMAEAIRAVTPPEPSPDPGSEPVPAPEPEPEPSPDPEPTPSPSPEPITAPTVRITSPAEGATVSGNLTITADAYDEGGISRVEFFVDGRLIATGTAAPFSARWNTKKSSGTVTLVAVAWNAAGESATSNPVSVTIDSGGQTKPSKRR